MVDWLVEVSLFLVGSIIHPGSISHPRCMFLILNILLFKVQESFELNHETLYTAVKMVDLYLSKKQVLIV